MDESALLDIILFAGIAVFLVFRLRSVLGQKNGTEKTRQNPFTPKPPGASSEPDVLVPIRPSIALPSVANDADQPATLAGTLQKLASYDPRFNEKLFLDGARAAFTMIVTAFADGDTDTLRPLLAESVYGSFASAIETRKAAGETRTTRILRIKDAGLDAAKLDGTIAHLTVILTSEQIDATRDANGTVIDGDAVRPVEVIDIWTFTRDMSSPDPNWALSETRVG
jgi:predicted lipid-binding transport protein (Tim44 family)